MADEPPVLRELLQPRGRRRQRLVVEKPAHRGSVFRQLVRVRYPLAARRLGVVRAADRLVVARKLLPLRVQHALVLCVWRPRVAADVAHDVVATEPLRRVILVVEVWDVEAGTVVPETPCPAPLRPLPPSPLPRPLSLGDSGGDPPVAAEGRDRTWMDR